MSDFFDFDISEVLKHISSVKDFGPLPISSFGFEIVKSYGERTYLEVCANDMPEMENKPMGSVSYITDKIILEDYNGSVNTFHNVWINSYSIETSESGHTFYKIKVLFSSVEKFYKSQPRKITTSVVEIVTMPSKLMKFWPNMSKSSYSENSEMNILGSNFKFLKQKQSDRSSWNVLNIELQGRQVSLLQEKPTDSEGILCFEGNPDCTEREKIRLCLSFALGQRLNVLSVVGVTIQGQTTMRMFFADKNTVYTLKKPPSLESREQIQNITDGLIRSYSRLDLKHVLNSYFDAFKAPEEKKGVYFGAAIEALQKVHEQSVGKVSAKLISDTSVKKKFIDNYKELVKELTLDVNTTKLLLDKVGFINQAPQKEVVRRFFYTLGMDIREVELNAWQRRNDAAHGNNTGSSDLISLYKDNIALMCFFNRLLLAVATKCYLYRDYYSLDHPIRHITSCIPKKV